MTSKCLVATAVLAVAMTCGLGGGTLAASIEPALHAIDDSAVAIFAFRDDRGRPTAWPVTPYRDATTVAVTSTLAYMRKTIHVRRDGRVAVLAGGWLMTGRAGVHADVSGDEFVARFLPQELRKYPPARDIVSLPFHRYLFSWYFGRVFMEFTPQAVSEIGGSDRATLVMLDTQGFPIITPVIEPALAGASFELQSAVNGAPLALADGPATLLVHMEPTMSDLRQLVVRGRIRSAVFEVRSRSGSLAPPPPRGWWGELQRHVAFHRQAREATRIIAGWKQ